MCFSWFEFVRCFHGGRLVGESLLLLSEQRLLVSHNVFDVVLHYKHQIVNDAYEFVNVVNL